MTKADKGQGKSVKRKGTRIVLLAICLVTVSLPAQAQGTVSDYVQAITLRDRYQALAVNLPEQVQWIRNTSRFWYRKTVPGGNTFVLVNADTQKKEAAVEEALKPQPKSTSATNGR
jgi:hypothetical protein